MLAKVENPISIAENLPPNTLKVSNIQGRTGFWVLNGVKMYTINVNIPNTTDSRITGIVDDMPSAFREKSLVVIFSGEYKESPVKPQYGGQSVYSLTLTSIEKK